MPFVSTSAKTGDGSIYLMRLLTSMIYAMRMAYNDGSDSLLASYLATKPSYTPIPLVPSPSRSRCVIQ
jgi:hypothetical protein